MAILTVNGTGMASKPADQIHIRLNLLAEDLAYDLAMAASAQQLHEVQQALLVLGYDKRALISENFTISTNYHSVQKEDHFEQVFAGYRANQNLILKLDKLDDKLNALLNRLSTLDSKPELYLNFAVKQSDDLMRAALELAVKDAHEKALILCGASHQALGHIREIRYPGGTSAETPVYGKRLYAAADQVEMQMEAADFSVQAQVEIVYDTLDKPGV